jgi:hypothetical protein
MIAASRPKPGCVLSIADATAVTLHLLAMRRRVLRIVVVVAGLAITLAIVSLPFAPLPAASAVPFLLCLWCCYVAVDTWLVFRWRRGLLRAWQTGHVNIGVFAGAIRSQPKLPSPTMAALLRGLPILPPLRDRDLAAPVRAAVAAFSNWRWTEETMSGLLPGVLVGLASALATMLLLAATAPQPVTIGITLVPMAGALAARYGLPARSRRQLVRELAIMAPALRTTLTQLAQDLRWPESHGLAESTSQLSADDEIRIEQTQASTASVRRDARGGRVFSSDRRSSAASPAVLQGWRLRRRDASSLAHPTSGHRRPANDDSR